MQKLSQLPQPNISEILDTAPIEENGSEIQDL